MGSLRAWDLSGLPCGAWRPQRECCRGSWYAVRGMVRAEGASYGLAVPQSLGFVLVHVVFSTKDRRPVLKETVRGEMHRYLAAVLSGSENVCVRVGGVDDHVHVAMYLGRTESVSRVVERLKVSSSKWVKTKGPEFARFRWQRGYAAFSVGLADRAALVRYIDGQEAHHQRRDFQGEMRAMFEKYGVAFDERFVWD